MGEQCGEIIRECEAGVGRISLDNLILEMVFQPIDQTLIQVEDTVMIDVESISIWVVEGI